MLSRVCLVIIQHRVVIRVEIMPVIAVIHLIALHVGLLLSHGHCRGVAAPMHVVLDVMLQHPLLTAVKADIERIAAIRIEHLDLAGIHQTDDS